MKRVLVLLNAKAGTLAGLADSNPVERIRSRFAMHGIDADVRDVPGAELSPVTIAACDSGQYDHIIAGGGDGTLNTVAGALIGSGVGYAVLPLGTFNHLAKELQIPLELDAAIDALAAGEDVPFNLGEVNGQPFLLFAAIGLYSDMIRHRDAQRKVLGRRKMWAGTIAFFKMLFRWPLMRVRFRDAVPTEARLDGPRLTSVVYVSISGYQMDQLGIADRPVDPRDWLNVLVLRHIRRRELLWQMLKGMFGRLTTGTDLELARVDAITIAPRGRRHVRVGYDGEVTTMEMPLRCRLLRDALRMRVPKLAADAGG